MSKIKLLKAEFNKETGVSTVEILTRLGRFSGTAKLNPLDAGWASEIIGCTYAEARATIKFLKAELAELRSKQKAIQDLNNIIECTNGYDPGRIAERKTRRTLYEYRDLIYKKKKELQRAKEFIKTEDKKREELHNKILNRSK